MRLRSHCEAAGLCTICSKKQAVDGSRHCSRCVLKNAARTHLKSGKYAPALQEIFDRQGGRCPYFGVPIAIGVDAELDHIVPRAKGGTNDLANLQWVHVWANRIKRDLDEDEFLRRLDAILPAIIAWRVGTV